MPLHILEDVVGGVLRAFRLQLTGTLTVAGLRGRDASQVTLHRLSDVIAHASAASTFYPRQSETATPERMAACCCAR